MSVIEGGTFKCSNHGDGQDFETADPAEWEAHKLETPHYMLGQHPCIYCQVPTIAESNTIVYRGLGKVVSAICDHCANENKIRATAKRIVLEDTNSATKNRKGAKSQ